jgi:hypothetical protein
MLPNHSEPARPTRSNLGKRTQIGGAIAVYIGVLLLLLGPAPTPPLNPHRLAWLFIAIGLFLFVAGTVARRLFLD